MQNEIRNFEGEIFINIIINAKNDSKFSEKTIIHVFPDFVISLHFYEDYSGITIV